VRAARVVLLLALLLAIFYSPLLDPEAVLATRDMVEYHLPMRAAFASLAGEGLPQWDPLAHGGQPLLSNPNYGALYPLSWLLLLLPPTAGLNLLVLLHAALAAWGAYRFAHRLGARAAAATLAALAYSCGPTFLSLLHTLNIALAMSFLPWMMAFTLDLLAPEATGRSRRSFLGLTLSLTAIFLLGDPLIVAISLLASAAFVLGRPAERLSRIPRLAAAFALGLALAAVQVLPALARLAESPRGAGLDWRESTAWSLPWQRFAELFFPNFFGDDSRPELALYFGWGIHDRDYPYLLWIAIGLPLLLLGLASWSRRDSPERRSFLLMTGAAVFLAFGRHNPLYRWAWSFVPGFDKVRFPEKFLLLALTAAIFAGAAGWQHLLDERERRRTVDRDGERRAAAADLPTAFAALLVAIAAGLALLVFLAPQTIASFASSHSGLPLSGAALERALHFYRRECLWALGFTLAALGLFRFAGWNRGSRRAAELAALALVALELWSYGRGLVRTLPAAALFAPPQVARELPPTVQRLFSEAPYRDGATELVVVAGNPRLRWARAPVERLDSRAGNLFGLTYALDRDFDLSLTASAARAKALYERLRLRPELAAHLLGAWSVSHRIERKPAELLVEETRGLAPAQAASVSPVRAVATPQALEPYRFVARAELFSDSVAAENAAVAAGLPLAATEYLIGDLPSPPLRALLSSRLDDARLRSVEDAGDRVHLLYAAAHPALLVVASTFDSRWQAECAGLALPLFETAAGYMAILVPAGEGEIRLRFRDPWVSLGAAVSATTILVALWLELRRRRLARAAAPELAAP
jgi:hypothetical protein